LNIRRFGVGEEDSFLAPFSFVVGSVSFAARFSSVVGSVSFAVGWLSMRLS
jgi:hypothetical protein